MNFIGKKEDTRATRSLSCYAIWESSTWYSSSIIVYRRESREAQEHFVHTCCDSVQVHFYKPAGCRPLLLQAEGFSSNFYCWLFLIHFILYPFNLLKNKKITSLLFFGQLQRARKGSNMWLEARKQYKSEMDSRKRVDYKIKQISKILSGDETGNAMVNNTRPAGLPLVNDWSCYKYFVR